MKQETYKVRRVGGCYVITIPQEHINSGAIKNGERLTASLDAEGRLIYQREEKPK